MSLDWSSGGLAAGLACYHNREFFDAHEHWEEVWTHLVDPERLFLQALIQVTVAMHHHQNSNRAGALSLLQRALRKLEKYPARFGGIDVGSLCDSVRAWLRALDNAAASPPENPAIQPIDR
jgi:uncharacterized protein